MRLTFTSLFRDGAASMSHAADRLVQAEQQVSSGRRLNSLSDDPSGASTAVSERAVIGGIDSYTRSSDAASSRLNVADSVLSDLVNQLTSAKASAASSRGTTVSQSQRDVASATLLSIRDAILGDLNTQFNGTYVFAGSQSTTAPYVKAADGTVGAYAGDTSPVSVDVDQGRTVQITYDGSAIAQGTDLTDIFAELSTLATAAKNGDEAGVAAGMDALDRAFNRATLAQSQVGMNLQTVSDGQQRLSARRVQATSRLSNVENVDLATAITNMTQADTAYRAALNAVASVGKMSLMDYLS